MSKKLEAIQWLRLVLELGLAEAKEATENTPTVLADGLTIKECENIKSILEKHFAYVEISKDSKSHTHNDYYINSRYVQGERVPRRLQCPGCRSLDVATVRRGDSLFSLIFGGVSFVNVCKSCGKQFRS